MTRDEIFDKVRDVLVDALAVDTGDVELESILTSDLGAESIDFLDIVFKLEQAFGIKISQGELFPENLTQNPTYVQSGRVTPEGLAMLKGRLPHVDFGSFESNPTLKNVGSLFTVATLVRFIEGKLAVSK
jgi:acyl carrier protein